MTTKRKQQVTLDLISKIKRLGISQSEAARRIGVSSATITNIKKGKWDNITTAWKAVEQWVYTKVEGWQTAETDNYNRIVNICSHAQSSHLSRAISGEKGTGKSFALKSYADSYENVFYVQALGDMSKRLLLQRLSKSMGLIPSHKISEMTLSIIDKLNVLDCPLIIIDEFDELTNSAMRVFKDLYNYCDRCGFVLAGGLYFKKRFERGVRNNSQSFKEMFSRFGCEFLGMYDVDRAMVQQICEANGITTGSEQEEVFKGCQGDLRRVYTKVQEMRYAMV